jgi:hypothetical protein
VYSLARAALAALLLAAAGSGAAAAEFRVDGSRLIVSGTFYGDREFHVLADRIRKNPAIKTIVMKDFYGGMVQIGSFMSFPQFIRDQKLATEVDGPCISACALAFLGGVKRGTAPGADPRRSFVAFHGIYAAGAHAGEYERTFVNALRRFTGGKMPEAVARRAYSLPQNGFLAFFDARRAKMQKGVSVVLCENAQKLDQCVGITGIDSVSSGVFTR